jgi:colanic acid/amylovoran biosynthesis glycosyltransferase
VNQINDRDVVHAHFGPNGETAQALSEAGQIDEKIVTSFYGKDASQDLDNNPDAFKRVFENGGVLTVLSKDMRKRVEKLGCNPEKIFEVPTGLEMSEYPYEERSKRAEEDYKLLTVARFTEKKGIIYGLEAVSELKEEYDITYNIIGDGERRDEIERKIEEEDIQEEVNLLGYKEHSKVKDYLYDSHILLAPSVNASDGDKEGLPVTILEAQATGMPVLSTYHAGIPEAVEDGETGILVPEKSAKDIEKGLESLFTEGNWSEMGKKGREKIAENYSSSIMIEKLEEAYRS